MCTELGLNMCTRTGIKHVYLGVQGACPQQAVTGTGGMARACEGRAVGAGLKLVYLIYKETTLSKNLRNRSCKQPSSLYTEPRERRLPETATNTTWCPHV